MNNISTHVGLSLSPRFDTFRLSFPSSLIPDEIYPKWKEMIDNSKSVLKEPIDIINESIQGVELPGIGDSTVATTAPMVNTQTHRIEPSADTSYRSTANPLSLMDNSITVTFRHVQGFYTYLLLYESWFYHHSKNITQEFSDHIEIEVMGEDGVVLSHIRLMFPIFESIDGLSLSYNKVERSSDTFSCVFRYSTVDFEIGPSKSE